MPRFNIPCALVVVGIFHDVEIIPETNIIPSNQFSMFQLKPEGGQIVSAGNSQSQPQTIALDPHIIQKLAKPELLEKVVTHELVKGGDENMVATQVQTLLIDLGTKLKIDF